MVIKSQENSLSAWAFLIGVILAVIGGVLTGDYTNPIILTVIIVLGLIVGYFVAEKDVQTFLFASVSSVIASFAGIQGLATNVALTGITVSGVELGKMIISILIALFKYLIPLSY